MNTTANITFKEGFNFSWEIIKKHWSNLLLITLVTALVAIVFSGLEYLYNAPFYMEGENGFSELVFPTLNSQILSWLLYFITAVASFVINFNVFKIMLKVAKGEEYSLSNIFIFPDIVLLRYFGASIMYGFLVVCGLILLVVPGIYFAIKYGFIFYNIVDRNMTIMEAAHTSAEMVSGKYWQIFGYFLTLIAVCIGIIVLGLLCLLIGVIPAMFIAGWISTFSGIYLYQQLK